ncbi:putative RNA polymerase III C11 subunit [Leishmania mexicana MHOM/GT/2001/U1103]|uniref:DNA-directed RNA polymerase subunit n=1 Tax=Leishmania mexicana (strain MHOM/GT/2001/U1103) TaxID=929439 RepID=E9ARZ4_LEIMU|nr:putative RNA polymerase III C11 subunit [Leishmania mexicana MHOM/GT/2001/U1103]CBZ25715.1 putative RNA polymerase III C11 subunit [Leishmania mexicana MHOM/GT/2001/U1103]
MFFCPFCSTLLLVMPHVEGNALVCATCRYVHSVASASPKIPRNEFGEPILTIQHSFVAHNRQIMDAEEDPAMEAAALSSAAVCHTTAASAPVVKAETSAEGGQITTIPCQNEDNPCRSTKAYFIQIQMRSADEPATVFFKCVECGHQWRQD